MFLHSFHAISFCIAEEPIEFIRHLQNQEVDTIPGEATFECEISRSGITMVWMKDNMTIDAGDDKYEIIADGQVHRLIVKNVDEKDEAQYTAVARGKTSQAALIMKGEYYSQFIWKFDFSSLFSVIL